MPAPRTATRATGDLRDELKGFFRGAKIGQMQCGVGIDHPDQRDVGKVEPFGNHLRAEQDANFTGAKAIERTFVAARTVHRVGIHPQRGVPRKALLHFVLESLGAATKKIQPRKTTGTAAIGNRLMVITIMTDCLVATPMVGECDFTLRTLRGLTAGRALDVRRKTAAVEQ